MRGLGMGRAQVSQDEPAIKPHVTETAADPGRSVTTYRVAMLTIAAGPILCLVRTLSARVATLDIDMPFTAQDNATLEIGGERISGALVKTGEKRAELLSRGPIDIATMLADPSLLP